MKIIIKKFSFLFITAVIIVSMTLPLFAQGNVTFNANTKDFIFKPGSDKSPTDLFTSFKDVMPGDQLTQNITLTNSATDCDYIKVYMRADVHDEVENPLTYSEPFENEDGKDQADIEGQRDETVASMQDFLSQLTMRIYNGEELIYEAGPAAEYET